MKIQNNKILNQTKIIVVALIIPILVLLIWEVKNKNGTLNTNILASPDAVFQRFLEMVSDGSLRKNIFASFIRVLNGYAIGAGLGLVIGTLNGLFKPVQNLLLALISVLRPIPPIALIPFFILWLGIGETSKIMIIVISSFWPVLLNTIQGIQDTDAKLLEVAAAFGKNKWIVFAKVVLPSAIPSIFTGLRLAISSSWTAVVVAEMIAASVGVGYLIQYARELAQPDLLLLGIITIGVIGLSIDLLVILLQKKVVYWKRT